MSIRPDDDLILEKIKGYGDDNFYGYVKMAFSYYQEDVRDAKSWIRANLPDLIRLNTENERLRETLKPFADAKHPDEITFGHLSAAKAALGESDE